MIFNFSAFKSVYKAPILYSTRFVFEVRTLLSTSFFEIFTKLSDNPFFKSVTSVLKAVKSVYLFLISIISLSIVDVLAVNYSLVAYLSLISMISVFIGPTNVYT